MSDSPAVVADLSDPKNASKMPALEVQQIGQDSEFFLWDTKKNQVVPSYKYYPKAEEAKPFRVFRKRLKKRYYRKAPPNSAWHFITKPAIGGSGGEVKLFRDGLAVEVNSTPLTCRAFMWNDMRGALLKGEPSRMSPHVVFTSRPWVELTPKMMEKFPDDLKVLGCSPSLDAYKQQQKTVNVDPMKTFFRTSGSHLHMSFYGHNTKHGQQGVPDIWWSPFIKLADALIGLTHTVIFADDLEAKRRKLYGQAGEFRYQPSYGGLEYRVLSSRLWDHQAPYGLLTGLWKYGLGTNAKALWKFYDRSWESEIQQAINEADHGLAARMLTHTEKMLTANYKLLQYSSINTVASGSLAHIACKMREMREAGWFPDAGVWSKPFAPDGHTGFNDYWANWKYMDPKRNPKPVYGD